MSPTALLLVLSAAVAHAAWNVIAHGSSRSGLPFLWWGAVIGAGIWALAVPFTGGLDGADPRVFLAGAGVSAILHVVYMLVLQRGYVHGDLATVYATARGTGPILTVAIALVFLGERPSQPALVGAAIVVLGVVALGLIGRDGSSARRLRVDPGLLYGALTGIAIASYTVWDAIAMNRLGLPPVAYLVGFFAMEVPLFTLMLGGARHDLLPTLRAQWHRLLAFGVLSPLSYVLVLEATKIAPIALIAPMREVSVVLVSLYGVLRFRQSRPALRIGAALIVVIGVTLIGL